MPLARFHMYAQGVDLWIAPTLAIGDGWIATLQHLARENRMFVVGVNPVLHADQIPAAFPHREQLVPPGYLAENGPWLEEGNTVIIGPNGDLLAGPVPGTRRPLIADLDLGAVLAGRRHMTPPATTTARTSSGSPLTPVHGRPSRPVTCRPEVSTQYIAAASRRRYLITSGSLCPCSSNSSNNCFCTCSRSSSARRENSAISAS